MGSIQPERNQSRRPYPASASPDFDTFQAYFRSWTSKGAGFRTIKRQTPSHMDCC